MYIQIFLMGLELLSRENVNRTFIYTVKETTVAFMCKWTSSY